MISTEWKEAANQYVTSLEQERVDDKKAFHVDGPRRCREALAELDALRIRLQALA